MAAKKSAANEMGQRAIDALYDAGESGMFGDDLIPRITVTSNEKRAWAILGDLQESGRVERSGVGEDARYQLTDEERDAEFMRRFYAGERGTDGN
jgi:hypothetical protein